MSMSDPNQEKLENELNEPTIESSDVEPMPTDDELIEVDPAAHDEIDLDDAQEEDIDDNDVGDPYGGHSPTQLKNILEAALFASGTTLSVSHLRGLFEKHERPHGRIVRSVLAELIEYYSNRGVNLVEIASGYRFQTQTETAAWVARLWDEKPQRYSRALMETIALIAYRQPITRGEIEDVRGVAVSSNIIRTLLEREWVRVVGHRDVPGRPAMYATTRQFLDYFGLNSLDQMPSLSEIRDLDELNPQMALDDQSDENSAAQDDQQSEISFSGLIEKIRDGAATGKTGSQFIDEQLDDELHAMDEVNKNFEQALEQQRAEHEHPDLELDENDNDEQLSESDEPENLANSESDDSTQVQIESSEPEEKPEISEEEQWKIIQEKLAQQQALLDDRENDPPREENSDE